MSKPILCLDFDGVLHAYSKGWHDGTIYDGPVPGAMAFLKAAVEHFDVVIYSSRSKSREGRADMAWAIGSWLCAAHGDRVGVEIAGMIDYAHEKPAAFLTIDDRAVCFEGTFPAIDELLAFKPWNQRGG